MRQAVHDYLFKTVIVIARLFIQFVQTTVQVAYPVFQPVGIVAHAVNGEAAYRFMMGGYICEGLAETFAAPVEL